MASGSVLHRLGPLVERLVELVDEQRTQWKAAEGLGHGLFIGEADVDGALAGLRAMPEPDELDAPSLAVERLQAIFRLEDVEVDLLVAAAAPDLDLRFGLVYGYLQDDPSRRHLTLDLALRLLGRPAWDALGRHLLGPQGDLARTRLLDVDDDPDVLRRRHRVPERVTAHLLGADVAPDEVARAEQPLLGGIEPPAGLLAALRAGAPLVHVRCPSHSSATVAVAAAADAADVRVVHLDLRGIADTGLLPTWLPVALREAALQGFVPLLGPVPDRLPRGALDGLGVARVPVLLHGATDWDVAASTEVPLTVDVDPLTEGQQAAVWAAGGAAMEVDLDADALARLRVGGAEAARALRRAAAAARVHDRTVDVPLVVEQVRREHAPALERLATRVVPTVTTADVILPAGVFDQLARFLERIRNRDRVREELGVRSRGAKGRGITGIFSGPSGTGKTLSAEAICGELGLDLYVIDIASVVSKYIGETEQNLERLFTAAEELPGILFFDEADALFGKRSEVSDARDRYANLEVAYLLQRLERFDGIVILASNLRSNLDEAFNRRLDASIAFPEPGEAERLALWEAHLPPGVPRDPALDLAYAARQFALSGGTISSAARSAAHDVLRLGRPLDDAMVARAVAVELEKAGRLVQASDFGTWAEHVAGDDLLGLG